jgi:hypothetical protein
LEKITGLEVDTVTSFDDLYMALKEIPYHGVLVDLATHIKTTNVEKELARRIQEVFPVLILKWEGEGEGEKIRTFSYKQGRESITLQEFIDKQCGSVQARTFRSSTRKKVTFNVTLSKEPGVKENCSTRTITIDASKGGCFVYTSEEWECFSNVWLVMNDLTNHTPIMSEIRQCYKWGESMRIPGIGVTFKDITKCQLEELRKVVE